MYLQFFRINTKHEIEWDEHNLTQNVEVLLLLKNCVSVKRIRVNFSTCKVNTLY